MSKTKKKKTKTSNDTENKIKKKSVCQIALYFFFPPAAGWVYYSCGGTQIGRSMYSSAFVLMRWNFKKGKGRPAITNLSHVNMGNKEKK